MKILQRPVLMTILFGIVCSISFIPLKLVLDYWLLRPITVCLTIWLFVAGYTLLLCWWSRQNLTSVSFPILYLFLTVFMVQSIAAFFYLALAGIGWIRSGICYRKQGRGWSRLMVESLLSVMGGVMVAGFNPTSAPAWILSIWLLFLLQALYFTIFNGESLPSQRKLKQVIDPFEQAYRRAEDILSK
jgi:hypothetical protein